jgi:endonuclease YncB( thermonuclease family)
MKDAKEWMASLAGNDFDIEKFIRDVQQDAIDTVVEHCEQKTYTTKDMEDFAEWVVKDGWKWSVYIECFTNNLYDESMKTITQLREHWEKGRRQQNETN